MRYENYQNVMLGFPSGLFRGEGISYRYARLNRDRWNITVGNFYEQFGSGLIFRSYEERGLGWTMPWTASASSPTWGTASR